MTMTISPSQVLQPHEFDDMNLSLSEELAEDYNDFCNDPDVAEMVEVEGGHETSLTTCREFITKAGQQGTLTMTVTMFVSANPPDASPVEPSADNVVRVDFRTD
jgi:hypothetical protein